MHRLIIASLFLASCGRAPVRIETVTVKVPVPVACVKRESLPVHPATPALTRNAVRDTELLAAWGLRYRAALNEALALLSGCVE